MPIIIMSNFGTYHCITPTDQHIKRKGVSCVGGFHSAPKSKEI